MTDNLTERDLDDNDNRMATFTGEIRQSVSELAVELVLEQVQRVSEIVEAHPDLTASERHYIANAVVDMFRMESNAAGWQRTAPGPPRNTSAGCARARAGRQRLGGDRITDDRRFVGDA